MSFEIEFSCKSILKLFLTSKWRTSFKFQITESVKLMVTYYTCNRCKGTCPQRNWVKFFAVELCLYCLKPQYTSTTSIEYKSKRVKRERRSSSKSCVRTPVLARTCRTTQLSMVSSVYRWSNVLTGGALDLHIMHL